MHMPWIHIIYAESWEGQNNKYILIWLGLIHKYAFYYRAVLCFYFFHEKTHITQLLT